jgi:hypothetical protein
MEDNQNKIKDAEYETVIRDLSEQIYKKELKGGNFTRQAVKNFESKIVNKEQN